jgi:hypothetical protein
VESTEIVRLVLPIAREVQELEALRCIVARDRSHIWMIHAKKRLSIKRNLLLILLIREICLR